MTAIRNSSRPAGAGRRTSNRRALPSRLFAVCRRQGAQERLVPVTNGSNPGAPAGGHSSQAGTLPEGVAVAVPDDPPDEDDVDPLPPTALDPVPAAPPPDPVPAAPPPDPELVAEAPDVDPVAGVPVAAAVEVAEVPPVVVVDGVVPVRLTTPLRATVPGVAAVCAEAGRATAIENNTT